MDTGYLMSALLLFVAVVLALEGLYSLWASKNSVESRRIAARLRQLAGGTHAAAPSIERIRPRTRWSWIDDRIAALPQGERLQRWLDTSGTETSASTLIAASAGLGLAGFALPLLFGKPLPFALTGALAFGVLPWWRVGRRRDRRIRQFERQIPEALDLMGRALRAGHAFPTAVQMVGDEMADPIGQEFRTLFDETNYGVPQQIALRRLADRVPVADLAYFVVAVQIQRESGGNLAELLDNISTIVRARLKLLGQVRTLSAEGRLSAVILIALPFVTALLINIITPEFMSVLWTDPLGMRLVGSALFMMVLGVLWMRKIIRIRV